jgi:hypothetical protein
MHKISKLFEIREKVVLAAYGKLLIPEKENPEDYDISIVNDADVEQTEKTKKGTKKKQQKRKKNSSKKKTELADRMLRATKRNRNVKSKMEDPETDDDDSDPEFDGNSMEVDENFPESGVVSLLPNVNGDDEQCPEFTDIVNLEEEMENWQRLFDVWTYVALNLDNKCVTPKFLERFTFMIEKFKFYLDKIVKEKGSSAYIHIVCDHSLEMLQRTRGLWLYSQQGCLY